MIGRVRTLFKILIATLGAIVLVITAICVRLFFYVGDLPDFYQLSRLAPNDEVIISDPYRTCRQFSFPGPSSLLPWGKLERIPVREPSFVGELTVTIGLIKDIIDFRRGIPIAP